MHIETEVYPEAVVLLLKGRLDFHSIEACMAALSQAEKAHRPRHLILDLHQLTFIDSMAIGRLVGTRYRLERDSIQFILAGQTGYVDTALREIKLEAMIPTMDSVEEALAFASVERKRTT